MRAGLLYPTLYPTIRRAAPSQVELKASSFSGYTSHGYSYYGYTCHGYTYYGYTYCGYPRYGSTYCGYAYQWLYFPMALLPNGYTYQLLYLRWLHSLWLN